MSAGANSTAPAGLGVQSATFLIWGVQLEGTSQMTALDQPDVEMDWKKCLRFYVDADFRMNGYNTTPNVSSYNLAFPTQMRAAPTIVMTITTNTNCTGSNSTTDQYSWEPVATITPSTGFFALVGSYTASADL